MSIADLMRLLLDGGTTSLLVLGLLPAGIGAISWTLAKRGLTRASQLVANAGIALGLLALVVMLCALMWGAQHGTSAVEDVSVAWLLLPPYLVVAGFLVEHWVHPGRQEHIRAQIRGAFLVVIVLTVLYWLLSRLRVWVLVHTGILGLLLLLGALVGILYMLVRKAI
ncbi:MAG: hypothetical protein KDK70_42630 [Myxococcales bacterium]|nr:hypothetical protein [Myxococcales bacterium]